MKIQKESAILGIKRFLPISPSVALFGIIFGFTGGVGNLPMILVVSSSFIIFAGSGQFLVILLIIEGESLVAMVLAGIIINLRHLLYGAALHNDISSSGFKKILLAYLLTDEAFLVTSLIKDELNSGTDDKSVINLEDVLFGAGIALWVVWNLSTSVGFLLTGFFASNLSNLLSPNFIVAATFLGYFVIQWQGSSSEKLFILLMVIISMLLSFFLQSSTLLIVILILGILFAMIGEFSKTKNQILKVNLDNQNCE